MQQKICVLIAAFLLFSLFSMSQSSSETELKPYFGQPGIKKKISELKAVKNLSSKKLTLTGIKPLKSYFNRYRNSTNSGKDRYLLGHRYNGKEGDENDTDSPSNPLRPPSAVNSTLAFQPWSNFLGIDFNDYPFVLPADPSGDVGGTQVIISANNGIKVFDKPAVTDVPVVTNKGYSRTEAHSTLFLTLDQFFSPIALRNSFIGDIHIRYDRFTKRWFFVADDFGNNLAFLAVSDGDKVTNVSSFTYYSFNPLLLPYDHDNPPLFDFPTLGIDNKSILIGANLFGKDTLTSIGYIIDKKQLIHGKLVLHSIELGVGTSSRGKGMYSPHGVQNNDPSAKKSFFAGISYYYDDGLKIVSVEYDNKNRPYHASESTVQVEPTIFPRENSAPGSLAPVDPNDTRLLAAAIYKNKLTGNSSLWTAHAIGVDQSGKSATLLFGTDSLFNKLARTGSRWYKIGNIYTKPRLLQSGTVYDADEPSGRRAEQYFNPSIAASGQGHSIVSGTTDAFNRYLNVFAAGRYLGDELGKTQPPIKLTNTSAIYDLYTLDDKNNRETYRWGDFSQTVVDPLDDQTIWTFQEYANVDDNYGVRAVQFKAPPPATPPLNAGRFFNNRDTTIILQGTSVDNSGFFDPGEDKGGPGYNRLSVKSTGGIIVSNIKFVSPTKISLRLNIKNKRAGQYLLIITNPDGQIAVSSYDVRGTTDVITAARVLPDNTAQKYITSSIVYPNPATDNVTLQINAVKEHQARIVLIDMNGKELLEKNYSFLKGTNQAVLATKSLPTGTYMATVYNIDNMLIATQKIVIQR